MCGICGIISNTINKSCPSQISQMLTSISHRGPDGDGVFTHENICIGHRRLAIIDPEGGKQPLANEDNSIWITYNGELYNFHELKKSLLALGHQFKTKTDTEVVVHAYEEWGHECVHRFRGMFAFCIVDLNEQVLFLVRDHFGIKPLCYLNTSCIFAFASEIQALKQATTNTLSIDLEAMDMYLRLGYIPAPSSIYQEVKKLPPASWMKVSFSGEILCIKRYWQVDFQPDYSKSEEEWLEELDVTLMDSVKQHLVSDVPFGAFLSGGLDSSLVVSYMSRILDQPVEAFSIGFQEKQYDETNYAKLAAKTCGAKHHIEIVTPDVLELLPKLVRHYGEPFADSSALPTYYVSKLASAYVPMVLSGDGGDELFAGYNSYIAWMKIVETKSKTLNYQYLKKYIFQKLFPDLFPKIPAGQNIEQWLRIMGQYPQHVRGQLWRSEYKYIFQKHLSLFTSLFEKTSQYPPVRKAQFVDINTYLPFDILTKVDVASMANGLEVRTPLIDLKVMQLAARLPEKLTLQKKGNTEWSGKYIIKKLLSRYFPDKFIHRPKMGFGVPVDIWFKQQKIHEIVQERLLSQHACIAEYFNQKYIRKMLAKGRSNRFWMLLFLEEWLQQEKN